MNYTILLPTLSSNCFNNLVEFDRSLFTTLNSAGCRLGDILMPIITHPLTGVPVYVLMLWLIYKRFFPGSVNCLSAGPTNSRIGAAGTTKSTETVKAAKATSATKSTKPVKAAEATSATNPAEATEATRPTATKYRWILFIASLTAVVATFGLCDWGSAEFFKYTICRLRPSHDPELAGSIRLLEDAGGLYGFVSSHAANLFGLALMTSLLIRKKWYTISIFVWAALVGYSRVYVGKHFPGDVVCGALYGMLAALLVWYIYKMATGRLGKAII